MMTTDLLVDTFIFKSENDLSAPDFVQDETTVRVDLGADDIGFGVAAQDNRTDIGYLIYTEEPVSERFSNMVAGASDRFFAVSYNASNHTWYYHANDKLYAFVPSATDRLVAVLDFGSDTAHILTGPQDPIGGIEAGVVATDLQITPQVWNGVYNNGEFSLTGTFVDFAATSTTEPASTRFDFDPDDLGRGVAAQDSRTDVGYLMYSVDDVSGRFSNMPAGASEKFFATTYDATRNVWFYHANDVLYEFVPSDTDRIVATLNYGANTANIFVGTYAAIGDVSVGVIATDLVIRPQIWNGVKNNGEFGLSGSYIEFEGDLAPTPYIAHIDFVNTDLGLGVAAQDSRSDVGYLVYSEDPISERFDHMVTGASEKFFATTYNAATDTWFYHANDRLYSFVPEASDHIVAVLNYGANTADILFGTNNTIGGIDAGVTATDLTITAQRWNNVYNNGEFSLSGTYIEFETTPPYVPTRPIEFNTRFTLPDGASGSAEGKGFTSTGLFYDQTEDVFWVGNHGTPRPNMAQQTSVVVLSRDGQTIVREYIIDDILGYESDNFTAQGVAVANNGTVFAAIDHKMVINFDKDGTFIRSFNLDKVNGVAFDALNNQLIVSSQSLSKVFVYDADTLELDRSYAIRAGADQLFFQEDTRELLATFGSNGKPGYIGAYNHDLGSFIGNSTKLSEITAAEGITIVDDQLIAVSDAYFHPEGAIDLNQMLIYDLYDQIGYDYLNTDALDYWF